jgi:hypothetical protein
MVYTVRDVMTPLFEGPEECSNSVSRHWVVDRYSRTNSIGRSEGGLWR